MKKGKLIALILSGIFLTGTVAGCRKADTRALTPQEYTYLNLSGTDALGRRIQPGAARKEGEKYVGIFYSLWRGPLAGLQQSIQNIQELLDAGAEGVKKLQDKSDVGQFYYWGEPLYGYYNTQDPWVLTRHVELLTMAGVDFLCIDATNAYDYVQSGETLLGILRQMKELGFQVPGGCFYTNTSSGTTANQIYKDYYESGKWDDLWYAPNGRPLLVGITENNGMASDQTRFWGTTDFVSPALQRYFEVKQSEWPNGIHNDNSMPWMSWDYPQRIHSGYISVPVAQHSHTTTSVSHMAPESHRGYDNVSGRVTGDYREGQSFQQMWNTVFEHENDVTTVLVCGWNEWMAQKQTSGDFVDVYNWEYSRDCEMMKGGYGDNYYLQLCQNIRKYKLTDPQKYEYPAAEINMDAADLGAEFEGVTSHYKDFSGDALARDFRDAANTEGAYRDDSNRNDITDVKVAHDGANLYFYVKTAADITEHNGTDLNWMNILIGDGGTDNAFAGYRYILNRMPDGDTTSVERYENGAWQSVGTARLRVSGNEMAVCVPLSLIGKSARDLSVEFKVADNVTHPDDIMDYYVTGDSAPIGRLSYSYGY